MKFLAIATIAGLAAASPCTPPPSNSAPQVASSKGIRFMVHVRDPKTDFKPSVDKTWLSSLRVGAGVNAITQDKDHAAASVYYVNGTAADVANHKADLVSDITFDGTDPSRLQTLGFTVADEPVDRPDHSPLKNTGLDSGNGTPGYGVTLKNQKQPYVTISGPNAQYPSEWYFCKQQIIAGPPVPILMTFTAGKYVTLPKDCALVDLIPECAELEDSVPNDPRHKLAVNSQCYKNPASVNWSKIN